jgi:hypothetical protein
MRGPIPGTVLHVVYYPDNGQASKFPGGCMAESIATTAFEIACAEGNPVMIPIAQTKGASRQRAGPRPCAGALKSFRARRELL